MVISEGVMVVKDGKAWGKVYEDETTRKIKELEATITLAQQQIQELKESK